MKLLSEKICYRITISAVICIMYSVVGSMYVQKIKETKKKQIKEQTQTWYGNILHKILLDDIAAYNFNVGISRL